MENTNQDSTGQGFFENMPSRTVISDVTKNEDGKNILNNSDKIIRWIKYQFEEQEIQYQKKNSYDLPFIRHIDLANCVINTVVDHNENPIMTNLCDILTEKYKEELPDCFLINGYGTENKIYHEVLIEIRCEKSVIHSAFFHQTRFHENVNFEGTEFKNHASFGSCIFEKRTNFNDTNITGNSGFEGCTFNGPVHFNKAKFDCYQVHFEYSVFKSEFQANGMKFINDEKRKDNSNKPYISFYEAVFHQELILSDIDFTRGCDFTGAKFYGGVNFERSTFTALSFSRTEINGHILFSGYSREDDQTKQVKITNISFDHSVISGRIDLEQCKIDIFEGNFATIKDGALLRISDSSIKKLDLSAILHNGAILFEDNFDKIEEIIFKGAIISGVVELENTEIKGINDRKTARVLKGAALKGGNNIDALGYRKKEMQLFKEEVNKPQSADTKFLLRLNGLSNNHGTDWPKGLLFTLCCWVGFYLAFLITSRIGDIYLWVGGQSVTWTFLQDFSNGISYLWSLNFLGTLNEWIVKFEFSTIWWLTILKFIQFIFVLLFYILGKIFIGYGIYQTISASRKYGKSTI